MDAAFRAIQEDIGSGAGSPESTGVAVLDPLKAPEKLLPSTPACSPSPSAQSSYWSTLSSLDASELGSKKGLTSGACSMRRRSGA